MLVFHFHCCILRQAGISMSPSESAAHIRSTLTPNQNPTRLCRKDSQCPRRIQPYFPDIHCLLRRRLDDSTHTSRNPLRQTRWPAPASATSQSARNLEGIATTASTRKKQLAGSKRSRSRTQYTPIGKGACLRFSYRRSSARSHFEGRLSTRGRLALGP